MSFREFLKELNGQRVEGELIKSVFYSLLTSFIFLGLLYFLSFKNIEGFMSKYGTFLFFAALSYALLIPAVKQVRAYGEMPCMSGMMVGMTTGMISGFLPGFYVASTNGMFIGGFFGVFLGIVAGIYAGKCCGVMGFMEGIMAGFMGGLMGAMTAFMLFNDNLKTAAVLVFAICAVIVFGMNYMVYKEMKELKSESQKKENNFFIAALSFVLIAITTWLIVYGPRSGVFG